MFYTKGGVEVRTMDDGRVAFIVDPSATVGASATGKTTIVGKVTGKGVGIRDGHAVELGATCSFYVKE